MKHLKVMLVAALFAAPFVTRAEDAPKVTFNAGGLLILNGFANHGDLDSRELPRFAYDNGQASDSRAFGMAARQSRLNASIGIPTEGLLAGAALKAFVEADFAYDAKSADTVAPRMRHYYITSTWKDLGNLTLLVGQTWGVAGGSVPALFPVSLAHWVMPRFGGAGFAFRRAPQVRVSADAPVPGPFALSAAVAALTPGDSGSALSASKGNDAAFPNFEGRISGAYKPDGKPLAEVGLWTHYGREKYMGATYDALTANSQAFGADVKVTVPFVTFIGTVFQGKNLDVLASIAGMSAAAPSATNATTGVIIDNTTDPLHPKAIEMKTKGGFLQAIVSPVKPLQLMVGAGMENPDDKTLALPGAVIASNMITKNTQYTAGAVVALTSKWKVSLEATRYLTQVSKNDPANDNRDVIPATQFEMGSVVSF